MKTISSTSILNYIALYRVHRGPQLVAEIITGDLNHKNLEKKWKLGSEVYLTEKYSNFYRKGELMSEHGDIVYNHHVRMSFDCAIAFLDDVLSRYGLSHKVSFDRALYLKACLIQGGIPANLDYVNNAPKDYKGSSRIIKPIKAKYHGLQVRHLVKK